MSRHVSRHTFRCPPPPPLPPPPPCHGGTAGTGDTGDTSAKPPPTRTIAWHTVPSPPPPPPPCHGGTRDIGDTREVHKHNKAQARLHETQNEFMQHDTAAAPCDTTHPMWRHRGTAQPKPPPPPPSVAG